MSRSITRILMIVVAGAALLALAFTMKVGASPANAVAWLTNDSGPAAQLSTPDTSSSASPIDTPSDSNPSYMMPSPASSTSSGAVSAQASEGGNDGAAEANASESAQSESPQSEQEQELSGVVASVDSSNSAFTLTTATGTVTVSVNSMTQYDDGLSGLGSLQAGMSITVKCASQSAGQAVADEVKGSSDPATSADPSSPDSGN